MKLNIEQAPGIEEVEITIRCGMMDERLQDLVRQIQLYAFSVTATREGRSYVLALEDIFYFESVDEKTFVYTKTDVYECSMRLYELEQALDKGNFVRVSKSSILNTARVESVKALMGSRLEAFLENGEKVLVNRHYVPQFKAKFGLAAN